MWRVGILTASDKGSRGERVDLSAQVIREMVQDIDGQVEEYVLVPDEYSLVCEQLTRLVDECHLDLVITTGGTGIGPRDITPEATQAVIDREVPGIAEAMRAVSLAKTPRAMLSRAMAGTRGQSLIINLPGSPKGVRECLEAVLDVLPHALAILKGGGDHQ